MDTHLVHLTLVVAGIVAATACIVTANVIFYQILAEVNAKRPADQQVSFLFVNVWMFAILRQHAGFFPSSQKRKQMWIWARVGFALFLLTFLSGFL